MPVTQFPSIGKCYVNNAEVYRTTSPFTEGPFSMNSNNLQDGFFSSADVRNTNAAAIIYENNVNPQFIQEMTAFWDSDANGILENTETLLFTYNIKIFISKDASYLKQAFEKLAPEKNDVCFFLEDNSTDILSERAAYIKIGSDFQSNLRDKEIISIIETKSEFFGRYQNSDFNGQTFSLDFTELEIAELIQTGQITNPKMSVIIALYQALNIQTIILTPVYSILYKGLNWVTQTARDYLEFKDFQWDPEAQKDDKPNENFQPELIFFFGDISEISEQNATAIVTAIKGLIDEQERTVRARMEILMNPAVSKFIWPEALNTFAQKTLEAISIMKQYLYQGIEGVVNAMLYIGEKWLNAVNAFYCGLWNSVVEIFVGIIDMIKYVFYALSEIGEAINNAQKLVPEMLEIADEFIQLIISGNFLDTITAAVKKIAEKIPTINLWSLTQSISVERVAYFIGNIGGFIVEMILEACYSGGLKNAESLFHKFGTVGSSIKNAFEAAIKGFVKSPTGFVIETITQYILFLIDILKQGKDKVLQWIDDFWNLLVDAAKLGKELIERIKELFGYTDEQISIFRDYGLEFVKLVDDGLTKECYICRILL